MGRAYFWIVNTLMYPPPHLILSSVIHTQRGKGTVGLGPAISGFTHALSLLVVPYQLDFELRERVRSAPCFFFFDFFS